MTDNAIRNEIGGGVAQLLFESGAIHVSRQQPFILAAGWASPVYVDVRIILGDPALRQAVTQLAVRYVTAMLPQASIDAVAGAETAGIPFAAWLADKLNVKMRYVRKRPLGIGRNAQVEGGAYLNFGPDWHTAFSVHLSREAQKLVRAAGLDPRSLAGVRLRVRGFIDGTRRPTIKARATTRNLQI